MLFAACCAAPFPLPSTYHTTSQFYTRVHSTSCSVMLFYHLSTTAWFTTYYAYCHLPACSTSAIIPSPTLSFPILLPAGLPVLPPCTTTTLYLPLSTCACLCYTCTPCYLPFPDVLDGWMLLPAHTPSFYILYIYYIFLYLMVSFWFLFLFFPYIPN